MKKFSLSIGDLELRTCGKHLLATGKQTTAEIVQWYNGDSCITLAYWTACKEGFNLVFVGNRPFAYKYQKDLWKLMKIGQDFLEEEFNERRDY